MNFLFNGVTALFLATSLAALVHLRWVRRLPGLTQVPVGPDDNGGVRCSVILPARNEEARIENTVRHLLNQSGVAVEIIAVNDRSSDRTGVILSRLAAEDARLRVIDVETLPQGWLGKCHACHCGMSAARGEWILFTDADCWLQPDVIARALQAAARDRADHVTLTPGIALKSAGSRAWHLLFLTSFLSWIAGVNRDRPKAYLGLGAFNLVRASAYRQCGGYEALRLTVLDDLKLGLLLRRAGKRTRAFLGADDVECHWGTRLRDMVRVMEKNYFAVLDFRLWLAVLGSTAVGVVLCILVLGIISGTPQGLVALLSPLSLIVPGAILARRLGWSAQAALGVPFMIPVFLYALLNSTFVTLRQDGVRWRDTFYALAELRAGGVR